MRRSILFPAALAAAAAVLPLGAAQAQAGDGGVTYLGRDQVKAAFAKGSPLVEVTDYKIHASRRESVPGLAEITGIPTSSTSGGIGRAGAAAGPSMPNPPAPRSCRQRDRHGESRRSFPATSSWYPTAPALVQAGEGSAAATS
jgi:hypothetical protein